MNNKRLAVTLPGLALKNPVMPASGSFGFGDSRLALSQDLSQLGAVVLKTTTKNARTGNPQPQIAQFPEGILNSVGLTNPGVQAVIKQKIPHLRNRYPQLPLLGSVAGGSVADYVTVAQDLSAGNLVQALEINVSCPNVAAGGMQFGVDPKMIEQLTAAVKKVVTVPIYVKLSPNVTDIVACAKAAQAGGADGLTMINTLYAMRIDPLTRKPAVGNIMGGWSGPSLKPLAVRMIYQVAHAVDLPIIGVGGISCAKDVIEMYLAGASAVQVGSAQFSDPLACWHIIDQLTDTLDELGLTTLEELRKEIREDFLNERR